MGYTGSHEKNKIKWRGRERNPVGLDVRHPARLDSDLSHRLISMNLATAFLTSAGQNANKTAVFWGDDEFSYDHFLRQSGWVDRHLRTELGVRPGDRVGVWLRNCPEFISTLFGILRAGGVVVPINNFLKADEVSYIVADAGIAVVITEQALSEPLERLRAMHPSLRVLKVEAFGVDALGSAGQAVAAGPGSLAVLIYTSGTTGHPKGAMLSHANLLHNVGSCRVVLEAARVDRVVILLPMFHSFMVTVGILLPVLVGGSIVLIKSLHPPKTMLAEVIRHQATILPGIPPLFRALAQIPPPPGLARPG